MTLATSYRPQESRVRQPARSAGKKFGHAVVIGSGIAGLTAARVLTDTFRKVTVIDRDLLPDPIEFRRGVPQTRHAHRLMPRGQMILEQQFPGLLDELLGLGAVPIEAGKELVVTYDGTWRTARVRENPVSLSSSRPLLESTLYRRLATLSGVQMMHGYTAARLQTDAAGERVTGVWLQCSRCDAREVEVTADLVVDASGRNSKAPQWLQDLGYTPPEEWSVDSLVGYATRCYERPAGADESWTTLYVQPTPPDGTRGGLIIPVEGNRWHVTLVGVGGDYPPLDEEGFLAFARSLPASQLYEAIRNAQPLSKPTGFRRASSRVRRYDRLPRYLEGFLVFGDAAYLLNPIYAQGMTAAAIGSQALAECLAQQPRGSLSGLSRAFQQHLSRSLGRLWQTVTAQDWQWATTTVTDNSEQIYLN